MTKASFRISTFQGALIVFGTSVGGGMLGLPVVTAASGFIPSACMMILSWLFMTLTGSILAELSCRKKHNANLVSLYSEEFPKGGVWLTSIVYFILFYALMVAYLLSLSRMAALSDLGSLLQGSIHNWVLAVALFGSLLLVGMRGWLSFVNTILVAIMAVSCALFFTAAAPLVDINRLSVQKWGPALSSLPLIFTSFGFQGTVPSLARLMAYDKPSLFKAIWIGTCGTLLLYLAWQAIIIGSIPLEGSMGLKHAYSEGLDAITPLAFHIPESIGGWVVRFGSIFAFSAVATSLIGVSVGMYDFIADLLPAPLGFDRHTAKGRALLAFAVYAPALLFSALFPWAFLTALSVAGGVGCAFILGFMPSITAYKMGSRTAALFRPWLLVPAILFFAIEILGELYVLCFVG